MWGPRKENGGQSTRASRSAGLPPACKDDTPFFLHSSYITLVNGMQKPEETANSVFLTHNDGVPTSLDRAGHGLGCAEDASLLFHLTKEGLSVQFK